MWWFLVPFFNFFSFFYEWLKGFSVREILNRRLDWMMTNFSIYFFLTGKFNWFFWFVKKIFQKGIQLLLWPICYLIPRKRLAYYERAQRKINAHQWKLEKKQTLFKQKEELLNKKIEKLKEMIQKKDAKRKNYQGEEG
ncbi:MAG: hypothetical protein Q8779_02430 [Candidatus Phytoplasma stylosanthis]|uniref:hypothetical protein n=1 Tax=Candidatus Phytoplasma stylosanthis TaxID=2798314 RepID=UPI00293B4960|nr:hypothetical protein [Candidatus Phytoplasma stylosanthis]MDV3168180.1 hypothetical protein [Candidatus Phytoplasma stylosanthis]MDV3174395.1 hypothetical protein [Candidatus Phytoplasma stylosanthis]